MTGRRMETTDMSLLFVPMTGCSTDWTTYTLIVPSVAVGNVAQLAVDILINSLLLRKEVHLAGRLETPCLRPMAGPNAYHIFSPDPISSCEVHVSDKYKLVLLQLRTPPFAGTTAFLAEQLNRWISQQEFEKIVILSSSFAQCLAEPESLSSGKTVSFYVTEAASGLETVLMDAGADAAAGGALNTTTNASSASQPVGTGFAFLLYRNLQNQGVKAVLLLSFCSEGDNRPDAVSLLKALDIGLLQTDIQRYEEPVSWQNMFGTASNLTEIF